MVASRDRIDAVLAELSALDDDLDRLTEAEFDNPGEFVDSLVNNLPAISYALDAGLPVTGWRPAARNANEAQRVERAIRQWGVGARMLVVALANGKIGLEDFIARMLGFYTRQSRNAYVAGRRAVGNLKPMTPAEEAVLFAMQDQDLGGLGDWMRAETSGKMGLGTLLLYMILDPTNYLGSGLPGDPFAGLPQPIGAGRKSLKQLEKEAAKYARRGKPLPQDLMRQLARATARQTAAKDVATAGKVIDNYANKIRSMANAGEMSGLTSSIPSTSVVVWWVLGAVDHCIDCVRLSDASPYYASQLEGNGLFPGSGHTRCHGNCHCSLSYEVPSEVCMDPMAGSGALGDLGIVESDDGQRFNVYVQEASTCRNPASIESIASTLAPDPEETADEAFSWANDVTMAVKGGIAAATITWADLRQAAKGLLDKETMVAVDAVVPDAAAMQNAEWWLSQIIPGGMADNLRVTRYEVDGTIYHAIWQDTVDAVRLEVGTTTMGLSLLEHEMTLKAISDLAQHAADRGVRLEINGSTANDGLRKWLESVGAVNVTVDAMPRIVLPGFGQQEAVAKRLVAEKQAAKEAVADAKAVAEGYPKLHMSPDTARTYPRLGQKAMRAVAQELDRLRRAFGLDPELRWKQGPQPWGAAATTGVGPGGVIVGPPGIKFGTFKKGSKGDSVWQQDPAAYAGSRYLGSSVDPSPEGTMRHEFLHIWPARMMRHIPDEPGNEIRDIKAWFQKEPWRLSYYGSTRNADNVSSRLGQEAWPEMLSLLFSRDSLEEILAKRLANGWDFHGEYDEVLTKGRRLRELVLKYGRDGGPVDEAQLAIVYGPGNPWPAGPMGKPKAGIAPEPIEVPASAPLNDDNPFVLDFEDLPPERQAQGQAFVSSLVADAEVHTRRSARGLSAILDTGHSRSVFATGTSATPSDIAEYTGWRTRSDEALFGLKPDAPVATRPAYAVLTDPGTKPSWGMDDPAATFGDIDVRLKADRVKARSTLTAGDSRVAGGNPATGSGVSMAAERWADPQGWLFGRRGGFGDSIHGREMWDNWRGWDGTIAGLGNVANGVDMIEVQIHGGWLVSEIDFVTFRRVKDAEALGPRLDALGIPWGMAKGPKPEFRPKAGIAPEPTAQPALVSLLQVAGEKSGPRYEPLAYATSVNDTELASKVNRLRAAIGHDPEIGAALDGFLQNSLSMLSRGWIGRMDTQQLATLAGRIKAESRFPGTIDGAKDWFRRNADAIQLADEAGTSLSPAPTPVVVAPVPRVDLSKLPKWEAPPAPPPEPTDPLERIGAALARTDVAPRVPPEDINLAVEDWAIYSGLQPYPMPVEQAREMSRRAPNSFSVIGVSEAQAAVGQKGGGSLAVGIYVIAHGDDGLPVAALRILDGVVDGVVVAKERAGWASRLYDYAQDVAGLDMIKMTGREAYTDEGRAFAKSWLAHRKRMLLGNGDPLAGIAPRAMPEVDSLAAWPDMGRLKPSPAALPGNETKQVLVDPAGREFLWRTGPAAQAEDAAYRMAAALGLRVPPVRSVEYAGQKGALRTIVPASRSLATAPGDGTVWVRMTDAQADEAVRQTVLDYLIANSDAHPGNWIVDDVGHLWGIDRSRAFRGASATSMDLRSWLGQTNTSMVGDAAKDPVAFLTNLRPSVLDDVLARIDALTDAEYASLIGDAADLVVSPLGTTAQKMAALLERKARVRDEFEGWFRNLAGAKGAPREWQAWLRKGGEFAVPAPSAVPVEAVAKAALPTTGVAVSPPIAYRSSKAIPGRAGNDLALWQRGFVQAWNREVAIARLEGVLSGTAANVLDAFSLEQLNMILARAEHMRAMGVDMTKIRRLSDFSKVPKGDIKQGYLGLTYMGNITALNADHRWSFLNGVDSPATVYNDIGGLFAHEYGHVVFGNLSATGQARVLDIYERLGRGTEKALSDYAAQDADEWFGEVLAAITMPGYVPGTVTYDEDIWGVLMADGIVHAALKSDGVGPFIQPKQQGLHDWIADLTGWHTPKPYVADPGVPKQSAWIPRTVASPPKREWPIASELTKAKDAPDLGPRMRVYDGPKDVRYVTKRATSGWHDPAPEVEVTKLGDRIGLNVNRVGRFDERTSIWRYMEGASPDVHATLTAGQAREVARQQVFDVLVGNTDSHAGQFLFVDGRLVGIDKDMAFWGIAVMGRDSTDMTMHWADTVFDDDKVGFLTHVRPVDVQDVLARIDAVPEKDYREMLERIVPYLRKHPQFDESLMGVEALMLRRSTLREMVEAHYARLLDRSPVVPDDWRAWLRGGGVFDKGKPDASVLLVPDGPPKKAPEKAWFAPEEPQQYLIPGSDLPLNSPLVGWSGKAPDEPPLPDIVADPATIAAKKAARDAVVRTWRDVAEGRATVAISWSAADDKAAKEAGLVLKHVGNQWLVAPTEETFDPLIAYVKGGGRTGDDAFWNLLGYSASDLDVIDAFEATKSTKRLSAGVVMVEPDGRIWILAPRGEWAGYQNTHIKGGVDAGETPAMAAVREMREEAGFSVELDSYLGDYMNTDRTQVTRMYIGHRVGGGPLWAKVKETEQIRLVAADEAKVMLTRRHLPDARDQAILADAVDALNGSPGTGSFAIPERAVEELAAKTRPPDPLARLWEPPAKTVVGSPAPWQAKPGIAPEPPVSTVYGWSHEAVKSHQGLQSFTPSSAAFAYNVTRWTLPNGEIATMYWRVDADNRLFWANSKKQVTDPNTRLVLHALHLANLATANVAGAGAGIKVSEELLTHVPALRELLVAAGATKNKAGKYLLLDADSLAAVGKAILDDTPLTIGPGAVPAAPLNPTPVSTTVGGAKVAKVYQIESTYNPTGPGLFTLHPASAPHPVNVMLTFEPNTATIAISVDAMKQAATDLDPDDRAALLASILSAAVAHAQSLGAVDVRMAHSIHDSWVGVWGAVLNSPYLPNMAVNTPIGVVSDMQASVVAAMFGDSLIPPGYHLGAHHEYVASGWDAVSGPFAGDQQDIVDLVNSLADGPPLVFEPDGFDAPVVAAAIAPAPGESPLDTILATGVDVKDKSDPINPRTLTTYIVNGKQVGVTWRRLGNWLEVHSTSASPESLLGIRAHTIRLGNLAVASDKILGIRWKAGFYNAFKSGDDEMGVFLDALFQAGGEASMGGVKMSRDNLIALRDQIASSAVASVPPPPAHIGILDDLGIGISPEVWTTIQPVVTPLKQGFSKVEWSSGIAPYVFFTLRYRTLSDKILWSNPYGYANNSDLLIGSIKTLEHLAGVFDNHATLGALRFDDMKVLAPEVGLVGLLSKYGLYTTEVGGKTQTLLPRSGLMKLRDDLTAGGGAAQAVAAVLPEPPKSFAEQLGISGTGLAELLAKPTPVGKPIAGGPMSASWAIGGSHIDVVYQMDALGGHIVSAGASTYDPMTATMGASEARRVAILGQIAVLGANEMPLRVGGQVLVGAWGKSLQDALIAAGGTLDGTDVVLSGHLAPAIADALSGNLPMLAPVDPLATAPLSASPGNSLSGQLGYSQAVFTDSPVASNVWNQPHGGTVVTIHPTPGGSGASFVQWAWEWAPGSAGFDPDTLTAPHLFVAPHSVFPVNDGMPADLAVIALLKMVVESGNAVAAVGVQGVAFDSVALAGVHDLDLVLKQLGFTWTSTGAKTVWYADPAALLSAIDAIESNTALAKSMGGSAAAPIPLPQPTGPSTYFGLTEQDLYGKLAGGWSEVPAATASHAEVVLNDGTSFTLAKMPEGVYPFSVAKSDQDLVAAIYVSATGVVAPAMKAGATDYPIILASISVDVSPAAKAWLGKHGITETLAGDYVIPSGTAMKMVAEMDAEMVPIMAIPSSKPIAAIVPSGIAQTLSAHPYILKPTGASAQKIPNPLGNLVDGYQQIIHLPTGHNMLVDWLNTGAIVMLGKVDPGVVDPDKVAEIVAAAIVQGAKDAAKTGSPPLMLIDASTLALAPKGFAQALEGYGWIKVGPEMYSGADQAITSFLDAAAPGWKAAQVGSGPAAPAPVAASRLPNDGAKTLQISSEIKQTAEWKPGVGLTVAVKATVGGNPFSMAAHADPSVNLFLTGFWGFGAVTDADYIDTLSGALHYMGSEAASLNVPFYIETGVVDQNKAAPLLAALNLPVIPSPLGPSYPDVWVATNVHQTLSHGKTLAQPTAVSAAPPPPSFATTYSFDKQALETLGFPVEDVQAQGFVKWTWNVPGAASVAVRFRQSKTTITHVATFGDATLSRTAFVKALDLYAQRMATSALDVSTVRIADAAIPIHMAGLLKDLGGTVDGKFVVFDRQAFMQGVQALTDNLAGKGGSAIVATPVLTGVAPPPSLMQAVKSEVTSFFSGVYAPSSPIHQDVILSPSLSTDAKVTFQFGTSVTHPDGYVQVYAPDVSAIPAADGEKAIAGAAASALQMGLDNDWAVGLHINLLVDSPALELAIGPKPTSTSGVMWFTGDQEIETLLAKIEGSPATAAATAPEPKPKVKGAAQEAVKDAFLATFPGHTSSGMTSGFTFEVVPGLTVNGKVTAASLLLQSAIDNSALTPKEVDTLLAALAYAASVKAADMKLTLGITLDVSDLSPSIKKAIKTTNPTAKWKPYTQSVDAGLLSTFGNAVAPDLAPAAKPFAPVVGVGENWAVKAGFPLAKISDLTQDAHGAMPHGWKQYGVWSTTYTDKSMASATVSKYARNEPQKSVVMKDRRHKTRTAFVWADPQSSPEQRRAAGWLHFTSLLRYANDVDTPLFVSQQVLYEISPIAGAMTMLGAKPKSLSQFGAGVELSKAQVHAAIAKLDEAEAAWAAANPVIFVPSQVLPAAADFLAVAAADPWAPGYSWQSPGVSFAHPTKQSNQKVNVFGTAANGFVLMPQTPYWDAPTWDAALVAMMRVAIDRAPSMPLVIRVNSPLGSITPALLGKHGKKFTPLGGGVRYVIDPSAYGALKADLDALISGVGVTTVDNTQVQFLLHSAKVEIGDAVGAIGFPGVGAVGTVSGANEIGLASTAWSTQNDGEIASALVAALLAVKPKLVSSGSGLVVHENVFAFLPKQVQALPMFTLGPTGKAHHVAGADVAAFYAAWDGLVPSLEHPVIAALAKVTKTSDSATIANFTTVYWQTIGSNLSVKAYDTGDHLAAFDRDVQWVGLLLGGLEEKSLAVPGTTLMLPENIVGASPTIAWAANAAGSVVDKGMTSVPAAAFFANLRTVAGLPVAPPVVAAVPAAPPPAAAWTVTSDGPGGYTSGNATSTITSDAGVEVKVVSWSDAVASGLAGVEVPVAAAPAGGEGAVKAFLAAWVPYVKATNVFVGSNAVALDPALNAWLLTIPGAVLDNGSIIVPTGALGGALGLPAAGMPNGAAALATIPPFVAGSAKQVSLPSGTVAAVEVSDWNAIGIYSLPKAVPGHDEEMAALVYAALKHVHDNVTQGGFGIKQDVANFYPTVGTILTKHGSAVGGQLYLGGSSQMAAMDELASVFGLLTPPVPAATAPAPWLASYGVNPEVTQNLAAGVKVMPPEYALEMAWMPLAGEPTSDGLSTYWKTTIYKGKKVLRLVDTVAYGTADKPNADVLAAVVLGHMVQLAKGLKSIAVPGGDYARVMLDKSAIPPALAAGMLKDAGFTEYAGFWAMNTVPFMALADDLMATATPAWATPGLTGGPVITPGYGVTAPPPAAVPLQPDPSIALLMSAFEDPPSPAGFKNVTIGGAKIKYGININNNAVYTDWAANVAPGTQDEIGVAIGLFAADNPPPGAGVLFDDALLVDSPTLFYAINAIPPGAFPYAGAFHAVDKGDLPALKAALLAAPPAATAAPVATLSGSTMPSASLGTAMLYVKATYGDKTYVIDKVGNLNASVYKTSNGDWVISAINTLNPVSGGIYTITPDDGISALLLHVIGKGSGTDIAVLDAFLDAAPSVKAVVNAAGATVHPGNHSLFVIPNAALPKLQADLIALSNGVSPGPTIAPFVPSPATPVGTPIPATPPPVIPTVTPKAPKPKAPKPVPLADAPAGTIYGPTTAPPSATPSFIYGYDPGYVASQSGAKVGEVQWGTGANESTATWLQLGPVKMAFSISPTGGRSGLVKLEVEPGASPVAVRNAAYAILKTAAEDAVGNARKGFFVMPDVYNAIPGMQQFLVDAGALDTNWTIGAALVMGAPGNTGADKDSAQHLLDSLLTDQMGKITPGFGSTGQYLKYDADVFAETVGAGMPAASGDRLIWKIAGTKTEVDIVVQGSAEWVDARLVSIGSGDKTYAPLAVAAQLYWLAQQGASRIEVAKAVLDEVTGFRQFLLAVGGTVDGGVIRVEGAAVNNMRKAMGKDALPVPLGGQPLPPSVFDDLGAAADDVAEAAVTHEVSKAGLVDRHTMTIDGVSVTFESKRSGKNVFWSQFARGKGASVGQGRAAMAEALRTFTNEVAQHAGLERLDIAESVLAQHAGLRDVLARYGATHHPASGGGEAYMSLARTKVIKLRGDIDSEFLVLGTGGGTSYIQTQVAAIAWPSADDLTFDLSKSGSLAGQTAKAVFTTSNGTQEWLFKPGKTGWGATKDVAIAELAKRLGLPLPPVRYFSVVIPDVDGLPALLKPLRGKTVAGSLQRMVEAKPFRDLSELSDDQMNQMFRHSVLDWLVNNDDAHIKNWLISPDGQLWAIDKTRAYKTWRSSHDRLFNGNPGNGYKPLLFDFWTRVSQDARWLDKVRPSAIAPTLRAIVNMPDEEFIRLMRPIAEKSEDSRYAGKIDKLLTEMLDRKHSVVDDFETYFRGEVGDAIKRDPANVPEVWRLWHAKGGHFSLTPTAEEGWREHLEVLEAKYGRIPREVAGGSIQQTAALYSAILDRTVMPEAKAVMDQFLGMGLHRYKVGETLGGGGHLRGAKKVTVTPEMAAAVAKTQSSGYGADYIMPLLLATGKQWEQWHEIQMWLVLSILDGAPGPRASQYDKLLREIFDPKDGTIVVERGSRHFATAKEQYDDLARQGSHGAKSYSFAGYSPWGHNKTLARLSYQNIITSLTTDISNTGEYEVLVRDIRLQDVITVIQRHMFAQEARDWLAAGKPKWN